MNQQIADKIRALKLKEPGLTYKQLGLRFNVSKRIIYHIITNKSWRGTDGTTDQR